MLLCLLHAALSVGALPERSMRILHVGSGNSKLPEDLWAKGYRNQRANDISPTAIARMAERTRECDGLVWAVEDALAMPQHADGSFDAVVDKGTFDALSCDMLDRKLVTEVRRVLRPGGVYVCISSLESTRLAFEPPRCKADDWVLSSSFASGGALRQRNCWLHCAVKPR